MFVCVTDLARHGPQLSDRRLNPKTSTLAPPGSTPYAPRPKRGPRPLNPKPCALSRKLRTWCVSWISVITGNPVAFFTASRIFRPCRTYVGARTLSLV